MTDLAGRREEATHHHGSGWRGGLSETSDASLVRAVAEHEHEAFTELYARHGHAVLGLARRLFGACRAEEVVQEVFLRLWNEPRRFDPGRGDLRSFLSVQVRGRGIDLIRSDAARRAREAGEARGDGASSVDVERAVLGRIRAVEAHHLVAALPERERVAVTLAFYGDCTYRQVAALLGQPEGTVKARIRSGLKRVRAQLSSQPR